MDNESGMAEAALIGTTQVRRFVYVWTLDHFSLRTNNGIHSLKRQMSLMDPRQGKFVFLMRFYPKVPNRLHEKSVSGSHGVSSIMRLKASLLNRTISPIALKGHFSVLDSSYRPLGSKWSNQITSNGVLTMSNRINATMLIKSLTDDVVKLQIEIEISEVLGSQRESSFSYGDPITLHTLALQKMEHLIFNSRSMDSIVIVDDVAIPTHQAILKKSPAFATILESGALYSSMKKIRVTDFELLTIKEILKFMYTNKPPDFYRLSQRDIFQIYKASSIYSIPKLPELTEEHLVSKIDHSNVSYILKFADSQKCERVKEKAVEYIRKNMRSLPVVALHRALEDKPPLLQDVLRLTDANTN